MTKEIMEGRLFISTRLHKLASAYINHSQLDGLFFECIGVVIFKMLGVPFFEENIKEALPSLRGDCAPGPDGFPIVFFPVCCHWDH